MEAVTPDCAEKIITIIKKHKFLIWKYILSYPLPKLQTVRLK